jgi:hypothetical protein
MSIIDRAPLKANAIAASKWIDAGLLVFPCCAETKKPKVRGWREPEKNGPEWKAHWARRPMDMPGLDCAYAEIVVIDCDRREERDGEATFRELCRREGIELIGVPTAKTPSGGRHFYFKQPAGDRIGNSAGELGPGIDVRADGGFVVVPGACRADGRAYDPANPCGLDDFVLLVAQGKLPVVPDALLRLIRQRRGMDGIVLAFPQPGNVSPNDVLAAGVKQRWDISDACARIAMSAAGTRNDTLNKETFIAGLRIAASALDPIEVAEQLSQAARVAGLSDQEIESTIQGALRRAAVSKLQAAGTIGGGSERSITPSNGASKTRCSPCKR